MDKQKKIVITIIIFLVTLVMILSIMNLGDVEHKKLLEEKSIFEINTDNETYSIDMEYLISLNPVDIVANLDTSLSNSQKLNMQAIELIDIINSFNISLNNIEMIHIKSLDGYNSIVSIDELLQDNNVYICIALDNEPLKTKSKGGMGPYLMIIQSSTFSQRWVKYIQEINIYESN